MSRPLTKFILPIVFAFFCSVPLAQGEDLMSDVVRANEFYANKKYQEAADSYETLRSKGLNNGYLYYNLGNTYIRLGKTGSAILNYIRALKLIPRDENLQANLKFAIQKTRDKIEPPPPDTFATLFFWVSDLNLNENMNLALIINLIFWLNLVAWFYFRSDILRLTRNLLFCLLLLAFLSIGVKLHLESSSKTGVVLAKTVEVKSGVDQNNVTLFELHEGALVTITDERRDWFEVHLSSKQKGWIPKTALGS